MQPEFVFVFVVRLVLNLVGGFQQPPKEHSELQAPHPTWEESAVSHSKTREPKTYTQSHLCTLVECVQRVCNLKTTPSEQKKKSYLPD